MKITLSFVLVMMCFLASAQQYKLEGNEVKVEGEILFRVGTAKLDTLRSDRALWVIKKYLDDKPAITLLRIEGHTERAVVADGTWPEEKYQSMSEQRAMAICKRLVQFGVDCKRLIAVGFGSQKPIVQNDTYEGRMTNKRISFVNAAMRDRPIGGMPTDGGGKVAGDICQ